MSLPSKTYAVRLPCQLSDKFDALASEFDLPPSSVLRLLLKNQLDKPHAEQVGIVMEQVKRAKA
jgi:hypothetical protein